MHSFCYVVPQLVLAIVPSHPTLYRLNMWSSWLRRNGTTQVMYIANLKDGQKRVKKNFSLILERVFEMLWWRGENGIPSKRIFQVEVSFSSQNAIFSFIWRDFWTFFLLHLLRTWVFLIFEEKITSSKSSFQMALIYWWWTHILEWSYACQHG
jgi:hypothetical protein